MRQVNCLVGEKVGVERTRKKKEPKKAAPCSLSRSRLPSRATGVDRAVPYLVVPGSHFFEKERERERKGEVEQALKAKSRGTCSEGRNK